jgi:Ca2+-binding RTX toxin-like protein
LEARETVAHLAIRALIGEGNMAKPVSKYTLSGTSNNDVLDGSTLIGDLQQRGLIINGNAGNDTLRGGSGQDVLNGGDGNDRIVAGLSDLVGVDGGSIVWDGGKGTDTLDLSDIVSDPGNGVWLEVSNLPRGTSFLRTNVDKNDASLDWDATFDASYTNNFRNFENVIGSSGSDIINIGNGAGANTIWGGLGNDYLSSGDGADAIYGEAGDDLIMGGWGSDLMSGGAGNDTFLITGRVVGEVVHDRIIDFNTRSGSDDALYDQIWLWQGWSIVWDAASSVLRGTLYDNTGVAFGDVTLDHLTYSDAAFVTVLNVDPATGIPL